MKNVYRLIMGLLCCSIILFLNSRCLTDKDDLSFSSNNIFDIYFLADSDLEFIDVVRMPISSLYISDSPVATINDILSYEILNYSETLPLAHSIKFKSNMRIKFGGKNRPFLLIANGERVYVGEYWANFMSIIPPDIFIYPYSDSEFHILSSDDGTEKINDKRILDALTKAGIDVDYIDLGGK